MITDITDFYDKIFHDDEFMIEFSEFYSQGLYEEWYREYIDGKVNRGPNPDVFLADYSFRLLLKDWLDFLYKSTSKNILLQIQTTGTIDKEELDKKLEICLYFSKNLPHRNDLFRRMDFDTEYSEKCKGLLEQYLNKYIKFLNINNPSHSISPNPPHSISPNLKLISLGSLNELVEIFKKLENIHCTYSDDLIEWVKQSFDYPGKSEPNKNIDKLLWLGSQVDMVELLTKLINLDILDKIYATSFPLVFNWIENRISKKKKKFLFTTMERSWRDTENGITSPKFTFNKKLGVELVTVFPPSRRNT